MTLPFGLDPISFCAGAALVLVLALAAFLVNVWWRDATSPFRPQIVAQTTKKTPWHVVGGALVSLVQYVGLALLVAAVMLVLLFQFTPNDVKVLAIVGAVFVVTGTLLKAVVR